jgi:dolichol-phosphate mannosyltransferase
VPRPALSVVIPVYNEEQTLPELHRRLVAFFETMTTVIGLSYEVVFVEDGSRDRTRELLLELAERDPRYCVVLFSRNFGHQMAITAGMDQAEGDAVVIMDADLQDPPEVVAEMYRKHLEGYDVVYGVRRHRKGETWFKLATASLFYRLLRVTTGVDIPADAGDFRLLGRPVVLTMRALRERHRFVRGLVAWVGFRQTAVVYDREARFAGTTKYPFGKMLRFAIDGISSFSTFPLRLATWLGVAAGLVAVGAGIWAFIVKFFASGIVPGWTTIMILVAFAASAQLLVMGVLGEYVGRIYEEIKRRPLYVVDRIVNGKSGPQPTPADVESRPGTSLRRD